MIAIAVVASLVAYAWVMGFLGGKTTQAGNAIQIQSYASNGNLVVYVQNTGQGIAHLKQDGSVYVNDTLYNIIESPSGTAISPGGLIPINVGQTAEVVTDFIYSPVDHIRIKIVTIEGTFMQRKAHQVRARVQAQAVLQVQRLHRQMHPIKCK